MFDNSGLMLPPSTVPISLCTRLPSSSTPALSHFWIKRTTRRRLRDARQTSGGFDFVPDPIQETCALIWVPLRNAPIQLTEISEDIGQVRGLELAEDQIRKASAVASTRETRAFEKKIREKVGHNPD